MTASSAPLVDRSAPAEPAERRYHPEAPPATPDSDPSVSSLMSGKVVGIVPDAPLSTALQLMARAGLRHLPVIDGPNCVGMLLESDVLERLGEGRGSLIAAPVVWVGHICRRPPSTVARSSRRSEVARRMAISGMDAVLVTDQGRIVGIVTATDLVCSLAEERAAPTVEVSRGVGP